MPTLAGFSGASLVPDIAGAVREDIGDFAQRRRDKKAKSELEKNLAEMFGGVPEAGTKRTNNALGILGELEPDVAQTAEAVRKSNDPEQIDAFRTEIDKGGREAKAMLDLNTHAERKKLIEKKFAEASARGEDPTRLVELSNMQEGELQVALTKMSLVADSARRVVPQPRGGGPMRFFSTPARSRATAKVFASKPKLGRMLMKGRSEQLGRDVTVSEGALGREATASEGVLNRAGRERVKRLGLKPSDVFEDVLNKKGQIVGQRNKATGKLSEVPDALSGTGKGAKPPTGFRRTNPDDPLSDLEPIPGGPGTQLSPEVAAKAGLIETALEFMDDAKKLFTKDFSPDARLGSLTGFGESGRAMRTITLGVEATLRAISGAGVPETEVTRIGDMFRPSVNDSVKTATHKLNMLTKTLENIEKNIFRGRGGVPSRKAGSKNIIKFDNRGNPIE